jgi:hypothetical protein
MPRVSPILRKALLKNSLCRHGRQERRRNPMDRRAAYASFENTVLDLYEQGMLTLEHLEQLAEQYRTMEIDSAGSQYLRAHDGKDLHQICIALVDPAFALVTPGSSEDHEEYWEQELKKWEEIARQRWGWQAYCTPFPQREPVGVA